MVMKTINNVKEGNWAGLATDLASVAVSFIPGVGTAAAMALQAGVQAGGAALQGGSTGDIIKAGAAGAAGAGAGAAIGKFGGSLLSKASTGLKNTVSKVKMSNTGQMTGAATNITNTTADAALDTATQNVAQTQAPVPGAGTDAAPTLRPKADIGSLKGQPISVKLKAAGNKAQVAGAKVANSKVGKLAGQYGAQGALSVGSTVAGVKQGNAANRVAEQSLLFQKQTYEEQTAKENKVKAQLKEDAWTSYSSSKLFGEELYNSSSTNTNLLTSYTSNGTGNAGTFSLLNSGVMASKKTDLT